MKTWDEFLSEQNNKPAQPEQAKPQVPADPKQPDRKKLVRKWTPSDKTFPFKQ